MGTPAIWRGMGDRIRWAGKATLRREPRLRPAFVDGRTVYTPPERGRSGAQKRKDRGRRGKVPFCQVVLGVHWETRAGEIVVGVPADVSGLVRVETRCGLPFKTRYGDARCPAHG